MSNWAFIVKTLHAAGGAAPRGWHTTSQEDQHDAETRKVVIVLAGENHGTSVDVTYPSDKMVEYTGVAVNVEFQNSHSEI
jgi:hypothetical protein